MPHPFNTFSLIARCKKTGLMGGVAASYYPGLGAFSPFIKMPYGIIASQGWVNPFLNEKIMTAMMNGETAESALHTALMDDPGKDLRQVAVVSANGDTAAHTGKNNDNIKLHLRGDGYVIAGNLLTSRTVLEKMEENFLSTEGQELSHRLMSALMVADQHGGDCRGKKAAVIRVTKVPGFPYIDFRIDDDDNAIAQLKKIYDQNADKLIADYDDWVQKVLSGT